MINISKQVINLQEMLSMLITVSLIEAVNNLVKNDCADLDKEKPFLILRGVLPSQHISQL